MEDSITIGKIRHIMERIDRNRNAKDMYGKIADRFRFSKHEIKQIMDRMARDTSPTILKRR